MPGICEEECSDPRLRCKSLTHYLIAKACPSEEAINFASYFCASTAVLFAASE
jgi:hypothetical protein